MNCSANKEKLPQLAAGILDATEESQVRDHCRQCPACDQVFHELGLIHASLSREESLAPSPSFVAQVMGQLQPLPIRLGFRWSLPHFLAVTGLLMCVVLFYTVEWQMPEWELPVSDWVGEGEASLVDPEMLSQVLAGGFTFAILIFAIHEAARAMMELGGVSGEKKV